VGHGIPMNAFLIDIVSLRRLPQRLLEFVITAFAPSNVGIKYARKMKLLQDIRNPPLTTSDCQWKSVEFHSILWSVTQFCYEYLMPPFGLRTRAHVKLYIGLFHSRESQELSASTIDGRRYSSVRVTNSKKCDYL
jgi:hypothetical protein